MPKHINLYQDHTHAGWVLEVRAIGGEWYTVGVFGSRAAALQHAS